MNPRLLLAMTTDAMTATPVSKTSHRKPGRAPGRLVVAGLLVTLALAACGKKDGGQGGAPGGPGGAPQALPVTVIEAAPKRMPITVDTVGQSEGSKEVQVRARVSGILLKQRFSEGDRVKRDAVLYQIDPAPYEIALAQARAALAQAQATLEQATREEARLKPLAAEQAISGKDYDDAGSTRKTSAANVMAKQADVRNAELNLSYTRVTAPIGGISGRNISSEGSLVTAGTDSALLTTIVQTDPIWVRFAISEAEYAMLRNGNDQNAKVELIGADGKPLLTPGKLNFAASTVDRTLGTVQLRAEVPNADLRILPGQFVRARLFVGEIEGVLVPQAAVLTSDKGKAVMVVGADNKVSPRPVDAGTWQGDQWVIRSGLAQGDKVVVDNLVKMRPGMTVAPHPPQAPGQGAPGAQPPAAGGDAAKADAPKSDAKQ
jgi:membrane fusion protein (multidrug efflux system)